VLQNSTHFFEVSANRLTPSIVETYAIRRLLHINPTALVWPRSFLHPSRESGCHAKVPHHARQFCTKRVWNVCSRASRVAH